MPSSEHIDFYQVVSSADLNVSILVSKYIKIAVNKTLKSSVTIQHAIKELSRWLFLLMLSSAGIFAVVKHIAW